VRFFFITQKKRARARTLARQAGKTPQTHNIKVSCSLAVGSNADVFGFEVVLFTDA